MSVVGIGTDIVDIRRIATMKMAAKEKLAQRVLTEQERQLYLNHKMPNAFLAKRWAAKEAAAKALGTGIAKGVSFQHIHIANNNSGQPILTFTDVALIVAKQLNAQYFHVSLSDEKHYATAFVVLSS